MGSYKILIIDDEKELCSLLEEYFSSEGNRIECAYDGQEGIERVKSFDPDIILLDHRMPIMDGANVIKEVREFSSIPIICISAVSSKEVIDECLELGATEYMFKPLNLDELTPAINSALNKS